MRRFRIDPPGGVAMQLRMKTAVLAFSLLPAAAQAQPLDRSPTSFISVFEQEAQPKQPPAVPKQPDPKLPDPKLPDPKAPSPVDRLLAPAFASGTEAGGFAARSYNENFDGDNLGVLYRQLRVVGFSTIPVPGGFTQQIVGTTQRQVGTTPRVIGYNRTIIVTQEGGSGGSGQPIVITTPVVVQDPVYVLDPVIVTTPTTAGVVVPRTAQVLLPAASRYSGIQITDNDSPRPTDRLYFGYQFYSDAGYSLNPATGGSDVQRQMAGFEYTLLDGDASVGMRLPYMQQYGPVGYASQTVGDLSVLFKYAFYNDLETGNLASAGLVVTTPTGGGGSDVILLDGSAAPHSTLFQPWLGFVRMFDAGYVQGITNLIVPTDSRDPTVYGASLGVGYFAYQNPTGILTGVIPRAEVHLRTPFNQRDPNGLVYFPDQVNVNGGLTLRFGRTALNAGVSVPVVGPRPWAVEAMSFLNVNF
ncbi:MAG: hypothetical protein U0804_21515 [Gemmataceae bacterium]